MKRRDFLKYLGLATAAVAVVATPLAIVEDITKPDLPGIGGQSFTITLDNEWVRGDVIRMQDHSQWYVCGDENGKLWLAELNPPYNAYQFTEQELKDKGALRIANAALER